MLTALFIGLGSIGTRHLKNLTAICAQRGLALRADALRSDLARPLRPGAAELLREYPITNASAGRTTHISTAVLDDTLYEYDYTTGELTATGLADRQTRTVTDALPPDPYEGRGAFDVTITRILNGQLVVEYYSNGWTDDNAETKTPV